MRDDKNVPYPLFSQRIREGIKKKGITQEEFAISVGLSASAISSYACGIYLPRERSTLERIARALEVTPEYLIGEENVQMSFSDYDNVEKKPSDSVVSLTNVCVENRISDIGTLFKEIADRGTDVNEIKCIADNYAYFNALCEAVKKL